MKGITWVKDYYGLFDYDETRHLTKTNLKVSNESMISRSGHDLTLNRYSNILSFRDQLEVAKRTSKDMPLLKIVNPDKNTIYLESATYLPHEGDQE